MSAHPIVVDDDWIQAVRARIGEIPDRIEARDIEQLRDNLIPTAWLSERPTADSIAPNELNRQLRRHLIASDKNNRFSALLIAWPPGHRTALHSHNGLWGIELVIDGALAIEEFHKNNQDHEGSLQHDRTLILGIGDGATFSSEDYVHSCRNLSSHRVALSLHVYGGSLDEFSIFQTSTFGQYTETRQQAAVYSVLG